MLKLMYITNDPIIASIADRCGVDRVWVDLEAKQKLIRQKNMNTVKSQHTLEDVKVIKGCLKNAQLMVRVNSIFDGSKEEIETALNNGAQVIMLPYYKTVQEVQAFLGYVNKRAKTILLLENKEAVECLDEVLKLDGIDEIHVGLNDLHLSYDLNFMFEPLVNGLVNEIVSKISKKGIPYGVGGIAKLGEGLVPAEIVIAQHYNIGSTGAILSRSFYDSVDENNYAEIEEFFRNSILEIRNYEKELLNKNKTFFDDNYKQLESLVNKIANDRRAKK